jgi:hypothetical protein
MSDKDKLKIRRDELKSMSWWKRLCKRHELQFIEEQLGLIAMAEKIGADFVYKYRVFIPMRGYPFLNLVAKVREEGDDIAFSGRMPKKMFDIMMHEGVIQKFICFDD